MYYSQRPETYKINKLRTRTPGGKFFYFLAARVSLIYFKIFYKISEEWASDSFDM
jgi:hypothetical protein